MYCFFAHQVIVVTFFSRFFWKHFFVGVLLFYSRSQQIQFEHALKCRNWLIDFAASAARFANSLCLCARRYFPNRSIKHLRPAADDNLDAPVEKPEISCKKNIHSKHILRDYIQLSKSENKSHNPSELLSVKL